MSYKPSNPNGQNTMANSEPVVIASNQSAIPVSGTFWQTTQPVSLASVPTHGVTGTFWQTTQPVSIASMPSTPVTGTFWQATQPVSLTSTTITGSVAVTGPLTDTQIRATALPVSLASVPSHPVTLASTTITGSVAVTGSFWQATQPVSGPLTDTQLRATAVPVSGAFYQATQPVSGTVAATQSGTWNIGSITTLPSLATGANVIGAVTQSGAWTVTTTAADTHDEAAGTIGQMGVGFASATAPSAVQAGDAARIWTTLNGALNIADAGGSITVDGTFWQATQPVSLASVPTHGVTGTFWQATQPVSIASMPSTPVTGTFWQTTQPVSGPLTDTQLRATAVPVSGTVTVTQATASNLNATVTGTVELGATSLAALENISVTIPGTVDLGTVSLTALETITVTSATASNFLNKPYGSVTTTAPAYTNGTDNALSLTTSGALRVDSSATTQPVSLASVPTHGVTGTFWQATQPVSIASMPSTPVTGTFWQTTQPVSLASTTITGSVAVTGPLTDTQIRATALPVSLASVPTHGVTGTFWQTTQPVSIASVPTHAVTLTSTTITGSVAVTGPLTDTQIRATALPVSIASMPSTPVTGTFWQATQPVSGTVEIGATSLAALETTNAVQSGTWNIGSITTLPSLATGANVIGAVTQSGAWTVTTAAADTHDGAAGTIGQMQVGYASSTAQVAVQAGDAARFWTTLNGALNIADAGGSITVDGTFWQATQPVSLASVPTHAVTLTSTTITGSVAVTGPLTDTQLRATAVPVSIASMPSTPVTGTFWQTTQPVSLASVPTHGVTGTFWQTTQPVSIASVPTHAVTQSGSWTVTTTANDTHDAAAGTTGQMSVGYASSTAQVAVQAGDAARFWTTLNGALNIADGGSTISIDDGGGAITVDGTVGISGTVPVSIASMPSTPVTGTFWQTTQPVSLASVPTHGVTGTFWQATQPVSLASVPTHAVTQSGAWTVTTTANDTHDLVSGTTGQMQVGYAYGVSPADNALPSISANADAARMLVNKNGALVAVHLPEATQAYAPTNATTTAYAASIIAKATAGTLYVITGYNSGPDQFMQIHDSATLPANTAVPKVIFLVPAASNFSYDLGNYGRYFAAGITICNSTTGPTKTIGAADCWIDVQYK